MEFISICYLFVLELGESHCEGLYLIFEGLYTVLQLRDICSSDNMILIIPCSIRKLELTVGSCCASLVAALYYASRSPELYSFCKVRFLPLILSFKRCHFVCCNLESCRPEYKLSVEESQT
jgi:hypothetical protein